MATTMNLSKKISLVLIMVVVLSGLLIGGLTIDSTQRSFDQYLLETRQAEISEWRNIYLEYYSNHANSWSGVERLMQTDYDIRYNIQNNYMRPIVLVAPDGQILAHPQIDLVGMVASPDILEHAFALVLDNRIIGYLLPIDYFDHKFWILENSFAKNVSRSIVKGIAVTSIIAIIIALILSNNMVRPLRELIDNVRAVGHDDSIGQVAVYSDDEIGQLATAFNQMAMEIEKNNNARVQLFADVSHELRTPLTAIAGTLENKLMRTEDLSLVEVSALYDEVLRMNNLVNELQNLSKLDAGHMDITKTLVDFKTFFRDFFLIVEADAESRHINVHVEMEENLPYCYADPERLKQVVLNLVSNALRYTQDGGDIFIKAWSDDKYFIFSVRDTGMGMTPQEAVHVFDRFYRSDQSRARVTGGTGLGMAITKGLVEAHGGMIDVQSKKEVGTTFTVRLPLYHPDEL